MSPLEVIAVAFGLANIALLIRRSIWNYPVALVMVTLYAWIFFHAHLFSDFLLQPFFFVVNIVGWVAWLRHRGQDGAVTVVQCSKRQILLALMGTAAGALLLGMLTKRFGAAYPFWDGTVAAASVTGQLLLTWRKLENWLWWTGADVVAIGVYTAKGLYLTAGLYAVFLVMAALGYVSWRRTLSTQQEPAVS